MQLTSSCLNILLTYQRLKYGLPKPLQAIKGNDVPTYAAVPGLGSFVISGSSRGDTGDHTVYTSVFCEVTGIRLVIALGWGSSITLMGRKVWGGAADGYWISFMGVF